MLGRTGIEVSRLCFGSLTLGPLQGNYDYDEGSDIISYAFDRGINFIDTAQLYDTYEYIKRATAKSGIEPVVSTKSYAYTREGAAKAFEQARKGLDRDIIDIFMLHEQESRLTLKGHRQALEFYIEQKSKGKIRAVGVSTHNVKVVKAAAEMDEIDVIHPIFNKTGIGIGDGSIEDMVKAIKIAAKAGKGIFSMKPLGGGSLIPDYYNAMDFVLKNESVHCVAVGMKSREEIDMNIAVFNNETVERELEEKVSLQKRKLHIEFWCENCGGCIEKCRQKALKSKEGRILVDDKKCVLCGYCCATCPAFAMKIF